MFSGLLLCSVSLHRVSSLKSESMHNQSTSVFSVRSTLGKIETMPQIGKTVCENAILHHKCKYEKVAT